MKDLLSKAHYYYKIYTLLMKSSAYSLPLSIDNPSTWTNPNFCKKIYIPPFYDFSINNSGGESHYDSAFKFYWLLCLYKGMLDFLAASNSTLVKFSLAFSIFCLCPMTWSQFVSLSAILILTWYPLLKLYFEISGEILLLNFFQLTTGVSNIESNHSVIWDWYHYTGLSVKASMWFVKANSKVFSSLVLLIAICSNLKLFVSSSSKLNATFSGVLTGFIFGEKFCHC